jgi:hypothetical protein
MTSHVRWRIILRFLTQLRKASKTPQQQQSQFARFSELIMSLEEPELYRALLK